MYSRSKTIARLVDSFAQLPCQLMVGDILISANRTQAFDGEAFSTVLRKFKLKVLHKYFPKGVSIVTRSDDNRLHCHTAVQMPCPATSFDWTSFEQSEHYYKLYKTYNHRKDLEFFRYFTKKYRKSLPIEWQKINTKLMVAGKRYGLGRVFLTPVRKNMNAYKWYLVSNIPYKRDTRDEGIHFLTSWGMNGMGGFQVINKYTCSYRDRLKRFAQSLQLNSENYNISLRSVLGTRWFFRIKDIIRDFDKLSPIQQIQYNELQEAVRTHILRSNE